MKSLIYLASILLIVEGCNSKQQQQEIKSLSMRDSILTRESSQKDSSLNAYLKSMNDIQANLDSIKSAENILSANADDGEFEHNAVDDIRSINTLLLKYHREIYALQSRLNSLDSKNNELQKMQIHIARELAEKDSSIAVLQKELAEGNDSLKTVMTQFNDSMVVINRQKGTISNLTAEVNTVYYAVGTIKEFKKEGVIVKEGGFAGIGRSAEMKQNFNTSYFTKDDKTKLQVIPLNSRFEKLVTNHPSDSYQVTNNSKSDSLIIKDPETFWGSSKYLIVVVK